MRATPAVRSLSMTNDDPELLTSDLTEIPEEYPISRRAWEMIRSGEDRTRHQFISDAIYALLGAILQLEANLLRLQETVEPGPEA
jgi:hypothetical protein